MRYRQLGNSGVRVSVVGLGTNRFGSEKVPQVEVNRIIDEALDLGINFIDTADVYQAGRSEQTLGRALKGRWDQVVLATKFESRTGEGPNERGASRYHMMNAIEASLERLQCDHIDLYYVHRWDNLTPIEETLRGLDDLVRLGKLRYVGASNFAAWQLAQSDILAKLRGWAPFVVAQNQYNMMERDAEREMLSYCSADNIGFVPFYPLAGGFLTGKYTRGQPPPPGSRGETSRQVQQYMTDPNYAKVERLAAWAAERGHTMNELAHAWLLAHAPVCSVISGATTVEHVRSNAESAEWALTSEQLKEVNAVLDGETDG